MSDESKIIEISVAIASSFVASAAFVVTIYINKAVRRRERAKLYLDLKVKFAEIYKNLPIIYKKDTLPDDEEDVVKLNAYWQHCFDEWYVTTILGGRYEKHLWDNYFSGAIVRALRHGALREAFIYNYEIEKRHKVGRKKFYDEISLKYEEKFDRKIDYVVSDQLEAQIDKLSKR